MSRFIQPTEAPKPEKDPKPTPKFGGNGGRTDYSALSEGKKIITPNGGRR